MTEITPIYGVQESNPPSQKIPGETITKQSQTDNIKGAEKDKKLK